MSAQLGIPSDVGDVKKKRPRRKAPTAPKKKKTSPEGAQSRDRDNADELPKRKKSSEGVQSHGRDGTPKKKKSSPETHDKHTTSLDVPSLSEEKEEGGKSMRRSVSPRKEQYTSLLDEMVGKGDMVLLESITEDAIIENLERRYTAEEIYVS
jgi:myosin heavy subunit